VGVEAVLYGFRAISHDFPVDFLPIVSMIFSKLETFPRHPEVFATMCRLVTRFRFHLARLPHLVPKCLQMVRWCIQHPHERYNIQAGNAIGYLVKSCMHAMPAGSLKECVGLIPKASQDARVSMAHALACACLCEGIDKVAMAGFKAVLRSAVDPMAAFAEDPNAAMEKVASMQGLSSTASSQEKRDAMVNVLNTSNNVLFEVFKDPLAIDVQEIMYQRQSAQLDLPAIARAMDVAKASGAMTPDTLVIPNLVLPAKPKAPPMGGWDGRDML